ncbi:hypothetical protein [Bradyrhizobium sp. MOS003]|uniref:hypothetical protein n=1 Tax=Bradyrhizobium sp. MOS003 TaxID=2133946 RepID=UPI000D132FCD|nr:hypothetical protein [Bradyrhizobium sp. MOS003]PSO14036.1 hypothetical protein C7G42_33280 [Bradyrhizobium sp. MOS003]
MNASRLFTYLSIWAGLWFAPLVWAVNMQLGQILPYADCRSQLHSSVIISFVGAALTSASGIASWSSPRRVGGEAAEQSNAHFGGIVSALSASVFTFALLMQGVAAVVLTGCEK